MFFGMTNGATPAAQPVVRDRDDDLHVVVQLLEAHLGHPVSDVVASLRGVLASARSDPEEVDFGKSPVVVHRLRNHLGALRALVYRLEQGDLTAHEHELLRRCHENARQMTAIVTAVVDLAKFEAHGRPLDVDELDVMTLVRSVVDSLRMWARRRDLDLMVVSGSGVVEFRSSEGLLRLIVSRLVEAAHAVSAPERLSIGVDGDGARLRIVVVADPTPGLGERPFIDGVPLDVVARDGWGDGHELAVTLLLRALAILGGQAHVSFDRKAFRVVVPDGGWAAG